MTLSAPERAALQTRTLIVLFLGTIGARAANTLTFTVASLAVLEMLDNQGFAGLPAAITTLGTALSSRVLSSYMSSRGRRPGLVLGFMVAVVGLVLTGVGVQTGSLVPFLAGLMLFGVGQGSANLARYAAADLAELSNRAKAISLIVFASTIGAVGGPLLIGPADRVAESVSDNTPIGPYAAAALCMALAAFVIQVALRPDPLVVSGGLQRQTLGSPQHSTLRESLAIVAANRLASLALVGMITAQVVMVMVMVMTPRHMKLHDHELEVVGWVISVHTAGMFMFAPIAGWASDRFGRVRTIMQGAAILVLSTVITALAGDAPMLLLFPGLFLLGLGWSFAMVSASALLTESVQEADRVGIQGTADLLTSGVSGLGALAAGFVFDMSGYHVLSLGGTMAAGLLFVLSYVIGRLPPIR